MLYLKREANVFFIFLIAIFLVINAKSSSATECGSVPVDNCDITQNTTFTQGNYSLPNGINIRASNIVLDCNGSILNGTKAFNSYGIESNGDYDDNLITDCTVMNYDVGIFLRGGDYNGPDRDKILGNILEYNDDGIYMLTKVRYSEVSKNTIQNNYEKGIHLGFSNYVEFNKIWNNNFINNTLQAYDLGYGGVINYWNSSGQGNYWNNYDSEAEGCEDNNSDLSCDIPYNISGGTEGKDYLPSTGVQILSILPIQVVEDVDMVKGKTTLVRATMENVGLIDKNITVELYFEDNLKSSENETINAGQEKDVDLWFVPDIAGNNKEIKIEIMGNN